MGFLRPLISDTSAVPSVDDRSSLDRTASPPRSRPSQHQGIASGSCSYSQAETENVYLIQYKGLQTLAGNHTDAPQSAKTEISEMNRSISRLQTEIEGL